MHYQGRNEDQIAAILAATGQLASEDVSTLLDRVGWQQHLVGMAAWEETLERIEAEIERGLSNEHRFREVVQARLDATLACREAGISGDAEDAIVRATRALALWRYIPTEQWAWLYAPFADMWCERYPETPHPFLA